MSLAVAERSRGRRLDEATPETIAKLVPDVVLALRRRGALRMEHETAAVEIRHIHSALGRGFEPSERVLVPKGMRLGQAKSAGPAAMTEREVEAWEKRYRPWLRGEKEYRYSWLPASRAELAIFVIVDNVPLRSLARRYGLNTGRIKKALVRSLERYVKIARW